MPRHFRSDRKTLNHDLATEEEIAALPEGTRLGKRIVELPVDTMLDIEHPARTAKGGEVYFKEEVRQVRLVEPEPWEGSWSVKSDDGIRQLVGGQFLALPLAAPPPLDEPGNEAWAKAMRIIQQRHGVTANEAEETWWRLVDEVVKPTIADAAWKVL